MEIRLDTLFYPSQAIKRSIRDYRHMADFACEQKGRQTLVRITKIRNKELEPLFRQEFCNYVLSQAGTIK